ncbi:hypothetical protein ACFPZ0_04685 [Streptomonospora nanhaiensis]|uniref:Uncharacterized protein (DUF1778 family) n=1 Tax=Streptomonospora nanhaiensis TaxID=1323731 RepID=A0A853BRX8_9ACTN|nr:hypothetical protein [Streptomonospora nanhaiensis]NYI97466.1 uncharacterized protein (DUF1778 family) [Streptomonospora nanhaiensis]
MAQRRRGNRQLGVRRDKNVKLSLSEDEHALLSKAALAKDMTLSSYCADAAVAVARDEVDPTPDVRQTMVALNDQITRLCDAGALLGAGDPAAPHPPDGTADTPGALLRRISRIVDELEDTAYELKRSVRR